jgi:hypothetical protein
MIGIISSGFSDDAVEQRLVAVLQRLEHDVLRAGVCRRRKFSSTRVTCSSCVADMRRQQAAQAQHVALGVR